MKHIKYSITVYSCWLNEGKKIHYAREKKKKIKFKGIKSNQIQKNISILTNFTYNQIGI